MKLNKYIFILLILPFAYNGYSQKSAIRKATKEYDKFSYIKTSDILLQVALDGYKSADLFQKLGNSFYFNNNMEEASKWYGELMALNEAIDPEYYFRYAQALKFIENYTESDTWMQKFIDSQSGDLRGKSFAAKRDYLKSIERLSESFVIENMDLNTALSDFGSNQYKNTLVFASSRESGKLYKWNDQPYLELYAATKQEDGSYSMVEKFDDVINTKFHESTASFLPTDDVMFFTRNNFYKKRLKRDEEGINRLQLYRARLQDDESWGEVESVHFNSEDHSNAHPAVNITGTKLYFASDMDGTLGNSDIYVVDINPDGTLGEPVNLGAKINTEGSETFPYVNSKGDLYYSSNGLTGLGGLDVYMIRDYENKIKNHEPFTVENVGRPINSSKDDFGYYENLGTKEGFFTSNRDGGKGDDDIYTFKIPDCLQDLEGIVMDESTKELITGATVRLFDETGDEINNMIVGDDAKYVFKDLICDKQYLIRVEKADFSTSEERILSGDNRKVTLELDMEIQPDVVAISEGTNLRDALSLNPIYFDLDKSNIRPDAEVELQKVIAVLKQYPDMKIEVNSHTDSRAEDAYNDALSGRRNRSTIKYIVNVGGISASRLSGQGYGERQLVNKCADGVPCTEEEHQLNRRSDFIIKNID
ncbi:MAG: OmpA family protein [Bacteroidia bacterium]|nr:OmpA family protein [Bacteroidia bacterium]